jgi:hypothetical protein
LCPQDRFCLRHRSSEFTRSLDCVPLHTGTMPKRQDRIGALGGQALTRPIWRGSWPPGIIGLAVVGSV